MKTNAPVANFVVMVISWLWVRGVGATVGGARSYTSGIVRFVSEEAASMARKIWVRDPDAGGVKIPDDVKVRTTARLERHAEKHFKGKYSRLSIRFWGQCCICLLSSLQHCDDQPAEMRSE